MSTRASLAPSVPDTSGTGETGASPLALGPHIRQHPRRLSLLGDLLAMALAVGVALVADDGSPGTTVALAALWLALMGAARAYEPMPPGLGEMRLRRLLRASVGLGLACWVLSALAPQRAEPGALVLLTATVTAAAAGHRVANRGLRLVRRAPDHATPVVVAGDPDDVRRVLTELRRSPRWDVVAVCATRPVLDEHAPLGAVTHVGVQDLVEVAAAHRAEAVIGVPGPELDPASLRRLSWQLERTGVHLLLGTGLLDVGVTRATLVHGGDLAMLHVRPTVHAGPAHVAKQLVERTAAAAALVVLGPILLLVALAVRLETPGGAIFRQTRIGQHGQPFTMLKFRSMSDGADRARDLVADGNESDGVLFKIRSDPRVTRVGRVIRRYSLDELPQLVNVVRGDMSLVGPRPALPDEVERYDADARRRLAARPGLTGLWQVSGRSDLSWEDTVRLDLHYVDNWSFLLDAGIVLRTVGTVLGHRGAY